MGAWDLVDMFRGGSWASVCGDFIFVDKWVHPLLLVWKLVLQPWSSSSSTSDRMERKM